MNLGIGVIFESVSTADLASLPASPLRLSESYLGFQDSCLPSMAGNSA